MLRHPLALRRTAPETDHSPTRFIMMPSQVGGVRVTQETALQISAVWACVTVIAKAIAASSWDVFKEGPNGDRQFQRNGKLFRLLNVRPNPEMTAFAFRENLIMWALISGSGYAEIEREASGLPIALWPLHPDRMEVTRDANGGLAYRIHNQSDPSVVLPARDVFHLRGPGLDPLLGNDIARLAARTFGHAIAAEAFGAAFYGNGAHAGAVVETAAPLKPEQAEELRRSLNEPVQGPDKAHNILLLSHGLQWKPMSIEPEKAQFIETRQHLVEEVARWFGVPPHKIQHLLRSTFNNIEEQGLEFVRDALTPWAERLRQEAESKLLAATDRTTRTRFELDWLVEGKAKDKADADAVLVNNGIETRNQVRRRRGLNASDDENADKLTVQAQMMALEDIGKEPEPVPEPVEVEPVEPPPDDTGARLDRLQVLAFADRNKGSA